MGGVEQAKEDGVRGARSGSELWLVQGAYEEWMVDPLDRSDLAGGIGGGNSHSSFGSDVLQARR